MDTTLETCSKPLLPMTLALRMLAARAWDTPLPCFFIFYYSMFSQDERIHLNLGLGVGYLVDHGDQTTQCNMESIVLPYHVHRWTCQHASLVDDSDFLAPLGPRA